MFVRLDDFLTLTGHHMSNRYFLPRFDLQLLTLFTVVPVLHSTT
jgi:hypothetical protein